jgi:hypothetical protein
MVDVAELRVNRAGANLEPYGPPLSGATRRSPVEAAEEIIADGWARGPSDPVPITPPVPWDGGMSPDLSWMLHAWRPYEVYLRAYDESGDVRWLRAAAAVAKDWLQRGDRRNSRYAWYDMAAGQRAYRLAYLVDAAVHADALPDQDLAALAAAATDHAERLLDDEFFAGHSNHGYFQIAGMLALGKRLPEIPECLRAREIGLRRLRTMLDEHFTPDGVHREHSPGYHAMMSQTLTTALASGLTDDADVIATRDRAERALAWFVMPDGSYTGFGDTHHRLVSPAYRARKKLAPAIIKERFATPVMRSVASAGHIGRPPRRLVRKFGSGGYLVMRSRWPDGDSDPRNAAYLALMGAFHSRVHKHADDLSIVWWDAGRHLLVDAGRYGYVGGSLPRDSEAARLGYWYADPSRMYCESTRAHNTVEVDGRDQDRTRPPYGSGVQTAGTIAAVEPLFYGTATATHGSVIHRRAVVMAPGSWLTVVDLLVDRSEAPHLYRQWFHAAPDLDAVPDGDGFQLIDGEMATVVWAAPATGAAPIPPIRGQAEPVSQGWHSPREGKIVPATAFGWESAGDAIGRLVTVFSLVGSVDDPVFTAYSGANRIDLGFRTGGATIGLQIDLRADPPISISDS